MGIRSRGLATAVAALLLVSLPAYAQDESSTVAFDGVGFAFDEALGASVNITQVPAEPPEAFMLSFPQPGPSRIHYLRPTIGGCQGPTSDQRSRCGVVLPYGRLRRLSLAVTTAQRPTILAGLAT